MYSSTSLGETINYLSSVFGLDELSDRLEIEKRTLNKIARGSLDISFGETLSIAKSCGFTCDNVIHEDINAYCAERFLKGEKLIMPKKYLEGDARRISSFAILNSFSKYQRNRALNYLQVTPDCFEANKLADKISSQLNIDLLAYFRNVEPDLQSIGRYTQYTFSKTDFGDSFKGLSIKDCYEKMGDELFKQVTESSEYKLAKLNSKQVVLQKRFLDDQTPSSDICEYEVGFGSMIQALGGNSARIIGHRTKCPTRGDSYSEYTLEIL